MYVVTLIVYCMSRGGAAAAGEADAPANTAEFYGSSAAHTVPGGSGDNVSRIPQTENQEVRSVL
jgi:hypothetical protein